MTETYHLVRINELIHWLARGWAVQDELHCHHGAWSVLMRGPHE
jgi:hypothetical protein